MASTIQLKTGTGSAVPSSLTQGEVGINIDNGLIYYGSGSGNDVKQLESFTHITASGNISASATSLITAQDLTLDRQLTVNGDSSIAGKIIVTGNVTASNIQIANSGEIAVGESTKIATDNDDKWQIIANGLTNAHFSNAGVVINEFGASQVDFRVEGDSDTHLLFVDAGADKIAIGTDTVGNSLLTIDGDVTATNITASSTISASKIVTPVLEGDLGENTQLIVNGDLLITGSGVFSGSLEISGSDNHITASGDISASGNLFVKDGFFTRGAGCVVEVIGSDSAGGGFVGTDTAHDLILRRNNTEISRLTSTGVKLTTISAQNSEATSVMINGSGILGTRELGSNAFTSTTIGTTTNALTIDNATLALNSGTTFNGSAAVTLAVKDGGIDSDALAADITVTTLTATNITASSNISASNFIGAPIQIVTHAWYSNTTGIFPNGDLSHLINGNSNFGWADRAWNDSVTKTELSDNQMNGTNDHNKGVPIQHNVTDIQLTGFMRASSATNRTEMNYYLYKGTPTKDGSGPTVTFLASASSAVANTTVFEDIYITGSTGLQADAGDHIYVFANTDGGSGNIRGMYTVTAKIRE